MLRKTLEKGSSDYNLRLAIESGAPVEAAYAMASYYPARHWHLEHLVGSLAPGRFADVVLLSDPKQVAIEEVFADGILAADKGKYLLSVPKIEWPKWATHTIRIAEPLAATDFEIKAPVSTANGKVTAAVLQPYHWEPDFMTLELPMKDGVVERGEEATKLAIIDRYHGEKNLGKCSGKTWDRKHLTRPSLVQWLTIIIISGCSAAPMRRWRWQSMKSQPCRVAGCW